MKKKCLFSLPLMKCIHTHTHNTMINRQFCHCVINGKKADLWAMSRRCNCFLLTGSRSTNRLRNEAFKQVTAVLLALATIQLILF